MNDETTQPEKTAAEIPPHEVEFALPAGKLVLAGVMAALVVGGAGVGLLLMLGKPVLGAALGGVGLLMTCVGPLAISPWRARTVAKWGPHLMASQVISLMGVILVSVLLYFSTRPSELALSATIAAGFILAQLLQVNVLKSAIVDAERR